MEALWLFQQKNDPIPSAPAWLNTAPVRTGRQRDGEITDFIYASRLAWQITSEGSHRGSSPLITHRAALAVTIPPHLVPSVEYRSSIPKIFHGKGFQIRMCNVTDLHLFFCCCSLNKSEMFFSYEVLFKEWTKSSLIILSHYFVALYRHQTQRVTHTECSPMLRIIQAPSFTRTSASFSGNCSSH